jgi:O-antigen ligase
LLQSPNNRHFVAWWLGALLILPWLYPFAGGPSPAIEPWLVSAGCAVLVWLFRSWLTPQTVAASWLLAALVSAFMGLLQYFGLAQALDPWVHSTGLGEAFANLRQRNQFATLTSIGLLALQWHVAQWQSRPGQEQAWRPMVLRVGACALLLALGNAASSSRTGLLQWLMIAALALVWRPRGQWRLVVLSVGALAAYLLSTQLLPWLLEARMGAPGEHLAQRLVQDYGCGSRKLLWANVLHLIAQKPWFGWGWGELDYAHFITLYPGERFCAILDNAHNLPLHLAVELGVPAAVGICGGGLWLVWRARPWHEKDATRQLAWGVLAVILAHSMLEYPLWYGPFQIAFGMGVWLLCVDRRIEQACIEEKTALAPVWYALTATLLIACLAYAAWDYHRVSQIYLPPKLRSAAYRDHALDKIRDSWLFDQQVHFAELTTTPLTPANAARLNAIAHELLHFSPEARVAEKLIESARMLGRDDEARFFQQRLKAAFPDEYADWVKRAMSER